MLACKRDDKRTDPKCFSNSSHLFSSMTACSSLVSSSGRPISRRLRLLSSSILAIAVDRAHRSSSFSLFLSLTRFSLSCTLFHTSIGLHSYIVGRFCHFFAVLESLHHFAMIAKFNRNSFVLLRRFMVVNTPGTEIQQPASLPLLIFAFFKKMPA